MTEESEIKDLLVIALDLTIAEVDLLPILASLEKVLITYLKITLNAFFCLIGIFHVKIDDIYCFYDI